jgi:hypothetical protein
MSEKLINYLKLHSIPFVFLDGGIAIDIDDIPSEYKEEVNNLFNEKNNE